MCSVYDDAGLVEKAALAISSWTSAPIVSIPVFVLITSLQAGASFLFFAVTSVLFAGVLPLLIIYWWSKTVKKIATDIPEKEDRHLPLLLVICSYGVGTTILFLTGAPWLVTGLMLCYCTNTLIVFFITLYWKISIHTMGIAGPATALYIGAGQLWGVLVLILPLVMWSRVHLRRHTIAQVFAGVFLGFLLTGAQLFLIRQLIQ